MYIKKYFMACIEHMDVSHLNRLKNYLPMTVPNRLRIKVSVKKANYGHN